MGICSLRYKKGVKAIGQKTRDLEMLPDWVSSGAYTESFLTWLLNEDSQTQDLMDSILVKVPQKNFVYLFAGQKESNQCLRLKERLEFAGLFCLTNYELYDVSELLKSSLGVPKESVFLCKEETVTILEQQICEKISDIISNHWDEVLSEKKYETGQLLPALKREDVRNMAEHFYLEGITADEVYFKPQFTFGGGLPDSCYLLYLEHGQHTVNAMARHWIRKRVPALSKQRILYGCIKEEMRQIPAEGRLFKIRQIREILVGLKEEIVFVKFRREGKEVSVRMKASDLMDPKGRYSLACFSPRERGLIKRLYGNSVLEGLQVEDIQSVIHNRQVLFVTEEEQEAA